ncbi:MAG: nucleotide exchange factor GrpE [Bacteroidales bacterium]
MTRKKSTEPKENYPEKEYIQEEEEFSGESQAGTKAGSDQPEGRDKEAGAHEASPPADNTSDSGDDLLVKLAEMQDKYLRLSAEFDNYRKRTLKEKIELTKTASESLLLNLLPVLDDFERGLTLMDSAADCKAMKEGIDLIYSKFRSFLEQNGVKEIEAVNKDFDVDMHDAVTKIPAPEKKLKGKVVDVIQKGYLLNEKVIRFSKVIVGE